MLPDAEVSRPIDCGCLGENGRESGGVCMLKGYHLCTGYWRGLPEKMKSESLLKRNCCTISQIVLALQAFFVSLQPQQIIIYFLGFEADTRDS